MIDRRSQIVTNDEARRWQREFPGLADTVHLANCSHGPQARRVREALDAYLEGWRERGMDWDAWMGEVDGARRAFARLIGAGPDEVAVSTSASAAVASIASALDAGGPRRRVVTTEAEFPTVGHVWLAHRKYGLEVDWVPVRDGAVELEDYETAIDERTALVSATHVYYQNGFRQDLERIAELAHASGALLLADAYQSLGTCELDVHALDIDLLVSGNLKYLLGLPGIAFIYVKKELVERFEPALTGWFGRVEPFVFDVRTLDYAADARRFETGTPPIIAAVAARAGMEIVQEVGPARIGPRIEELSAHAIERGGALGLEYVGPEDVRRKGATTAFRVPAPHETEVTLKESDIIVSARGDVIRIAPHFFTTIDDIERALEELRRSAGSVRQ
ncbi:MAG: aminotransferase class V-fold PLP-dependent enzyme [Gemmatimonadetes bacterium]|uniref:Aminotransferase class V-fold PLP-dependent enzyme n=1 Tax=Candidatus Kutchimonas denitrificans TaxID=3056748 RepID=A0AAE4ZB02_9BACT|nr:aminotransferase class V-fold PLP-dependent enzyme [Gemmatimonadota bacterium]NIR74801.1 aminotransferase class V-fold PLP-dependent enzyme [Candidatus Kutchimonas denitrificans]NIR99912.1 aminotransferase class V-fold PLP-dependent enzyme [Gemmatimonadota bacterium]NIT65496.1 aminotransferase class V-fold PLP-dependent enzyme [Gemmatimonadota bacterium]NIU52466.1 aminotransferase class V-fold PLP-dependent enzyme [Gemmatimonadota bacterium]